MDDEMDGEMDGLVEAQIMISEKGKHLLTINRFKFCISHRLKDGSVQWRCSKKNTKCPAKLYTSGEDFKTILKFDLNHNHEPEKNLERQQLSNSIKRKASSDLYERPSKIIQRELQESSSATGNITANDLHLIRKNIYKCIKNQIPTLVPTLPTDLKEVFPSLEDVQPKTAKNEPLLLKENNKKTTGRENKTTKDEANKAVTNSVYKPTPPPHVKPTTSSAAKSASKPSANLQPLKKPPSASVPKTRAVPPPGQSASSSRVPSRIPNVKSNGLLNGEKRGGVGGGREGGVEKEEGKRWFFGRRNSKDSRDGGGRGRNEIKSISKSTTCLNNNTIETRKQVNGKPRRPSSVVESQNITIKRGGGQSSNKNADLNQLPLPGSLSRTSSVNDINNHQDPGKSSRDRLDRIAGEKSKDKKALSKNNNKIETDEPSSFQSDRQELEILQRQLQEMANEKTNLALQLGEHKGQLAMLQNEIAKLKMFQDQSNNQLEQLTEENSLLRNRLRDVAHSPLSDNEKQQLLYESHRHHSSAPASIATNVMDEHNGGDITTCPTPEWDKQSSGNVSEISVACLQDKINQMQETHYSTHEELQATLQELTDLQRQLLDHQHLTARLTEEKTLMFDSLCRQTERLTDARREVDALRHVLYSSHSGPEGIEQGQAREAEAEREEREAWLQEREELVQERDRAAREAEEAGRRIRELDGEVSGLRERVGTLEGMVEAGRDERRRVEKELGEARDEASGKVIEMDRLRDLLDIARTKITELEQDRTLSDKSEMDELLDNTRKEKDALEAEVADLREQLARSKNETEKLREQVSILQEECKVIRNNAKTTQSDLEYKNERLQFEKTALTEQLQQFQDAVDELQVQSQCQSEDKRQLSAVLSETQRNLSESERKIQSLEDELAEVQKLRKEENEEWEKFQNDLLTSVRVANDFKTEAQQDLQKMIMENKAHRDRVRQLESQIDKLKATTEPMVALRPSSFPGDDITTRRPRPTLCRQSSRQSVRSLIESIENAGKPGTKTALSSISRSSSGSSLNSLTSDIRSPSSPSPLIGPPSMSPGSPLREWGESLAPAQPATQPKTPLKEQQPNQMNNVAREWGKSSVITDSITKPSDHSGKPPKADHPTSDSYPLLSLRRNSFAPAATECKGDPLNGLVKNGGSKRNALLKWCQQKTVGYRNIDITNFSSSWNDGLALCALLHTYLPDRIPYDTLRAEEKRRNFSLAFSAAESVGIPTTLNINDMVQLERPDWQQVMGYVTALYKHFEV